MEKINWLEIAKFNLIMGNGFAEAYAVDHLTPEERQEFDNFKKEYLEKALEDCPF